MSVLHSDESAEAKFEALKEIFKSDSDVLYEQRHFHHLPCDPRKICCDVSGKFELGQTIQELLGQLIQNPNPAYSEGATVALHGYALAVLLRANPIYIAGVDLPTTTKSHRSFRHWFRPHESLPRKVIRLFRDWRDSGKKLSDFGNAGLENILMDFRLISEIAHSLNLTTISLSEKSSLNVLEHIKPIKPD
jgi:hypothetical protein